MLQVLLFFGLFFTVFSFDDRIIGGFPANPHSDPHIAHLDSTSFFCGGSLIKEEWVLTAAHCEIQASFYVILGDHDRSKEEGTEQIIATSMVIPHPQYNSHTKENDVMLIRLEHPAILSNFVQPISLPPSLSKPATGHTCKVCGWGNQQIAGTVYPDVLRCVDLSVIDTSTCNDVASYNGLVRDTMFCLGDITGGVDACQGDSGGPAVCEGQLMGVVSWGYGCGNLNFPGVYAKVSSYIDWINSVTDFN